MVNIKAEDISKVSAMSQKEDENVPGSGTGSQTGAHGNAKKADAEQDTLQGSSEVIVKALLTRDRETKRVITTQVQPDKNNVNGNVRSASQSIRGAGSPNVHHSTHPPVTQRYSPGPHHSSRGSSPHSPGGLMPAPPALTTHQQHVVHVHVNPGESFNVPIGDQIHTIQGKTKQTAVHPNSCYFHMQEFDKVFMNAEVRCR